MVRGTEILFTAALSALVLHRKLNKENLWGLALCLAGILLVGTSSLLTTNDRTKFLAKGTSPSAGDTLLGMLLIVIAEAVQASQIVSEDWLMSTADTKLPPVEVVGYEGLFGTLLMALVVLPVLQFSRLGREGGGLREDTVESLHMIVHSPPVAVTAASYIILMALYNLSGMLVTDSMGALSRTVAETARTLLVWGLDLFLYYKVHIKGATSIGEPWTSYSWLQALGFVVLVLGTALYAVGEEKHAKELREKLQRRARDEWSLLRASVGRLIDLSRGQYGMTQDERQTPTRPARIAGPARIRVALGLLQSRNSRVSHSTAGVDSFRPTIGRPVVQGEEQRQSLVETEVN
jgi:DNA polymerase III delta prime subunit